MRMRHLAWLAALLALLDGTSAQAQRPPLFGVWSGPIRCGPSGGRWGKLYMYGDGHGLLDLGRPSYAPDTRPAVAAVQLRQRPEADYVLIDQWVINGVEPRPQLAGQLGVDGSFSGQVLNDANCQSFAWQLDPRHRTSLMLMQRNPARAARAEATRLDPQLTPQDMAKMALVIAGLSGGFSSIPSPPRSTSGGGVRLGSPPVPNDDQPLPRVQGNVHGNEERDVQGNPLGRQIPY